MQTQTKQEEKVRAEIEELTQAIQKLQKKIDRTPASSGKLKKLCEEKDALLAQRNHKINLLNVMPRG